MRTSVVNQKSSKHRLEVEPSATWFIASEVWACTPSRMVGKIYFLIC